ncbi:hypothetical protein CMI37_29055 [Candidatus Pacearchaeota archaeon]|nr:hypothetical protein [Candidatus Pacearchaeota archaeon]|tara:strand:+ start:897 stop:1250 length:354 start_codon:yes stop_codon:yes gene_type:complete
MNKDNKNIWGMDRPTRHCFASMMLILMRQTITVVNHLDYIGKKTDGKIGITKEQYKRISEDHSSMWAKLFDVLDIPFKDCLKAKEQLDEFMDGDEDTKNQMMKEYSDKTIDDFLNKR